MKLHEALKIICPPDREAGERAQKRLDNIIKPLGSLGKFEGHLRKIAELTGSEKLALCRKAAVVFCADNGVVAQGITQSPQEVTSIVAQNLVTGETCCCLMAKIAGADVIPVDIGIASELSIPGLLNRKTAFGTKDFSVEPAMTREQAEAAVEAGIELAADLKKQGYNMLATGEMGIGNTTTSAAVAAVMLGLPAEEVAGRGAGLSSDGLRRKIEVISAAIELHNPNPDDPLDVLAKLGGFDIAGMAGLCIGGAVHKIPIVLDGVISCVAALIACALHPGVKAAILPSHVSAEPAGRLVLERLGLDAPLHAGMRLGEGTGAVATFPVYDMVLACYDNMVVFADENMAQYEQFV